MKTLTVMVIALNPEAAQVKAVAEARLAFGDRFVAARVNPEPVFAPRQGAERQVFWVKLSLTAGSMDEWNNSPPNRSWMNRLLAHLGALG